MNVYNLCLKLFPSEFHPLFSTLTYENLAFDDKAIPKPVLCLISSCSKTFFHDCSDLEHQSEKDFEEKIFACKKNAEAALDITWEQLNTGHWKDVDISWRYVYSCASLIKVLCLLCDKEVQKTEIILACDMGLLMGAKYMDNILSKIAALLSKNIQNRWQEDVEENESHNKIKKFKPNQPEKPLLSNHITSHRWISCKEFENSFFKCGKPVHVTDATKHWTAFSSSKWSVEYILEKAYYRTVPVEIGSKYTDENWTQKLMTVGEFVKKYIWQETDLKQVGYLAQHNLFDQIPELWEGLKIPLYIKALLNNEDTSATDDITSDMCVDINAWFGPSGTVSPLHHDPKHNFLVQVMGEKYVRLYHKEQTEHLYPREGTILDNTSSVDVEQPDLEKYPLFANASCEECILSPGHMLYIPPKCWHYVRSLSTSFSVSFWW